MGTQEALNDSRYTRTGAAQIQMEPELEELEAGAAEDAAAVPEPDEGRHSSYDRQLPRREALAFLSLFFVPGVGQAILLTVVPLEALNLLGSAWTVTLLYVGTGLVAVAARFSIPYLLRLVRRRFVFTLGTLSLAVSSILLAFNEVPALAAGLMLGTFAFACIEITSQLYLLDRVPRHALKHFEPIRIFASAGPWTVGPWFGVYLQRTFAFAAPFGIAAGAALILLILFWSLRLGENAALTSMRRLPPTRYAICVASSPSLGCA